MLQNSESRFQRFVIDQKVSLKKVLERYDYIVSTQGNCFCPFHDDTNHRSAKFYSDANGDSIFCFAEHKKYKASDALLILGRQDLNSFFKKLWDKLSPEERERLIALFHEPRNILPPAWVEAKPALSADFRAARINITQLLDKVMELTSQ